MQSFAHMPLRISDRNSWRQNSSSSSFASWRKIKIHDFTLANQDWIGLMIFKNLRIRPGSDSISLVQDWTRTEKFYSPLISVVQELNKFWWDLISAIVFVGVKQNGIKLRRIFLPVSSYITKVWHWEGVPSISPLMVVSKLLPMQNRPTVCKRQCSPGISESMS